MNKKTLRLTIATIFGALMINVSTAYSASYEYTSQRITYTASDNRTSTRIPESVITTLCGDLDGCRLRVGMYNWDGKKQTASHDILLYTNKRYKTANGVYKQVVEFKASVSGREVSGTSNDMTHSKALGMWSCHLLDHKYVSGTNHGDHDRDFHFYNSNNYGSSETCRLTIID